MPKYLVQASMSLEGLKGTIEEGGSARAAAVKEAVESVGGKLEQFYYCFGGHDVVSIADMPDNVTAAGLMLLINSTGATSTETTVLLTPAEIDEAVKLHPTYRAPGHIAPD